MPTGRPPKLDDAQVEIVRAALEQGARAHGLEADPWVLERVGVVVTRSTGVVLSRAPVWRLLTGRLGWSPQRSERRAVERDESERFARPGTTTEESAELKRANEILKAAASFFAAELDRPHTRS
ncbi:winged helix-turn-helix domain-containing protein [Streptomyces sp. Act-28]